MRTAALLAITTYFFKIAYAQKGSRTWWNIVRNEHG